jgi:cobalt/nickel transport system permease protein
VAPGVGYAIYALVRRAAGDSLRSRLLATAFAAWCSTVVAAIVCAGQLALAGTVAWKVAFPAMAGIHMLIAIGEAVITTLVVAAVAKARPELLASSRETPARPRYSELTAYGLLVSLGLVAFVAPFASGWPDGLEKVAAMLGFEHKAAVAPILAAPLPNYTIPGFGSAMSSTIVAGGVGTLIAFVLAYFLARVLTPPGDAAQRRGRGGASSRA